MPPPAKKRIPLWIWRTQTCVRYNRLFISKRYAILSLCVFRVNKLINYTPNQNFTDFYPLLSLISKIQHIISDEIERYIWKHFINWCFLRTQKKTEHATGNLKAYLNVLFSFAVFNFIKMNFVNYAVGNLRWEIIKSSDNFCLEF